MPRCGFPPVLVAIMALTLGVWAGYSFGYNKTIFGATFYLGTAMASACIGLLTLLVALCPTMLAVGVAINILAVDFAFHPGVYTIASGGGFVVAIVTAAILWEILTRVFSRRWEIIAMIAALAAMADMTWYNTHQRWGSLGDIVGETLLKLVIPVLLVRGIYVRRRSSRSG